MDQHGLDERSQAKATARRERLRGLMDRLERVLAEPAGVDVAIWRINVATVCDDLAVALDEHIHETEAELFAELRDTAPHVGPRIDRLCAEHPALVTALDDLIAALAPDAPFDDPVDIARERGVELLGALLRHRHAGADLLYEAYWVDVATAD